MSMRFTTPPRADRPDVADPSHIRQFAAMDTPSAIKSSRSNSFVGSEFSTPDRDGQNVKWQPNDEAPNCASCGHSFSVRRRRHHCRACGSVVCDSCSKKRVLMPHISTTKPQRFCDLCDKNLIKQKFDEAHSDQLAAKQEVIQYLKQELTDKMEQVRELKDELSTIQNKLFEQQSSFSDKEFTLARQADKVVSVSLDRIAELSHERQRLKQELAVYREQDEKKDAEITSLRGALTEQDEAQRRLMTQVSEKEKELQRTKEELQYVVKEKHHLAANVSELNSELGMYDDIVNELKQKLEESQRLTLNSFGEPRVSNHCSTQTDSSLNRSGDDLSFNQSDKRYRMKTASSGLREPLLAESAAAGYARNESELKRCELCTIL